MSNILSLTNDQKLAIFDSLLLKTNAEIAFSKSQQRQQAKGPPLDSPIDLGIERSIELGNAIPLSEFRYFRMIKSSHRDVEVTIIYNDPITGKNPDVLFSKSKIKSPIAFSGAVLVNKSQPGRSFNYRTYIDFEIDDATLEFEGEVSIIQPSAGPALVVPTVAATATKLVDTESGRKYLKACNQIGNILYLSDSNTVSPTNGFPVFHNEKELIPWTGEVWGYSVAAGNVHFMRGY